MLAYFSNIKEMLACCIQQNHYQNLLIQPEIILYTPSVHCNLIGKNCTSMISCENTYFMEERHVNQSFTCLSNFCLVWLGVCDVQAMTPSSTPTRGQHECFFLPCRVREPCSSSVSLIIVTTVVVPLM